MTKIIHLGRQGESNFKVCEVSQSKHSSIRFLFAGLKAPVELSGQQKGCLELADLNYNVVFIRENISPISTGVDKHCSNQD